VHSQWTRPRTPRHTVGAHLTRAREKVYSKLLR
jgi:hypothetical protein